MFACASCERVHVCVHVKRALPQHRSRGRCSCRGHWCVILREHPWEEGTLGGGSARVLRHWDASGIPKEGTKGAGGSWGWLSVVQLLRMLKQRGLAEITRLGLISPSEEETWCREKDEGSGICNAKITRTFSRVVFWFACSLLGMGSSSGLAD